jgi:hypothetical protein
MDDPRFRGQRLEIAAALSDRRATLYETAKALGRRSGDIQKALRQMHDEGIIEAADPEPTRGTEFWLSDAYAEALEDALKQGRPGQLRADQDVLHLRAEGEAAYRAILGSARDTASVAWAARLGADGEYLLALSTEAPAAQISALRGALEAAGVVVRRWRIAEFFDAEEMRRNFSAGRERAQLIGGETQ